MGFKTSLRAKGAPRCTAQVGGKNKKKPERPNKTSPRPFLSLIYPSPWIKSRSLKRLQGRGEGSAARVDAAMVKHKSQPPVPAGPVLPGAESGLQREVCDSTEPWDKGHTGAG